MLNTLKIVAAVLITLAVCAGVYTVRINVLEKQHIKALDKQKTDLQKQCAEEKAVTTEVSNELQTKYSALAGQYNKLKRVRPSYCVPVTGPTGGRDGTGTDGKLSRPHGVNSDDLIDYGRDAEQCRLQLMACQSFIKKTWALKR